MASRAEPTRLTLQGPAIQLIFGTVEPMLATDQTRRCPPARWSSGIYSPVPSRKPNLGFFVPLADCPPEPGRSDLDSLKIEWIDLEVARVAGTTEKLGAEALAAGVVTAAELDRWTTSMEQAAANGSFFCAWTMMLAAGTKP